MISPTLAFFSIPIWCAMCAPILFRLTKFYVRMLLAVGRFNGAVKFLLWWGLALVMIAVILIPVTIAFAIAVNKRSDGPVIPLVVWAALCLMAMFIPCYRIIHVRNASALRQVGFLK
jgi:hypothetical protein